MKRKRDYIVYLELMNVAVAKIFEYVKNADEDLFLRDDMMKDACLMQLIVIGENGGKVSDEIKKRFSDIEWQAMKAARNYFAHAYDFVEWPQVWNTITTVLPTLKPKIEQIIEVLENENNGKIN